MLPSLVIARAALKLRGVADFTKPQGKEGGLAPASSFGASKFQRILQGTQFPETLRVINPAGASPPSLP